MEDWRDVKTKEQLQERYTSLLPALKKAAAQSGYALAVHGSMQRDLDLIAMPWVPKAYTPESLMVMLNRVLWRDFQFKRSHWQKSVTRQPHGRLSYSMPFAHLSDEINQGGKLAAYIDISIMPPIKRKR